MRVRFRAAGLVAALAAVPGCDGSSDAAPSGPIASSSAEAASSQTSASESEGETPVQDSGEREDAPSQDEAELDNPVAYEESGPPDDYGLIAPSDPPPDPADLELHALAGYEVVAVYDKPDMEASRLGYLRLGQRTKVTKAVPGEGCSKSWHQLPSGGYACVGRGLVVDPKKPPYLHRTPPPPNKEGPLPYEYAYVRKWNSPMFYRIPDRTEQAEAERRRAIREAERNGEPPPGSEPEPVTDKGERATDKDEPAASPSTPQDGVAPAKGSKADKERLAQADALPSVTDDPGAPPAPKEEAEPPSPPPAPDPTPEKAEAKPPPEPKPEPEPEPEPIKLPLSPDKPWLEKGYFLSLGDKESDHGKTWWRTARNGYVEAAAAYTYKPKNFEGVVFEDDVDFPFGWVMSRKGTRVFELSEEGKLKAVGKLERRTFVDLSEETEVGGKTYMLTAEGQLIRKDDLRLADPRALPEGLQPWERWVDVDLDKQMLVAYEGIKPVFTTLVSSGRKGTADESFETPTGRWRIKSKHISTTMAGTTASDGTYSIQDVPWTMYFHNDIALHGAFWHESFGRVRSHGCVNLGPSDARWLFLWTTPFLPEGWHGVFAHEGSPGTTVIVRKGETA